MIALNILLVALFITACSADDEGSVRQFSAAPEATTTAPAPTAEPTPAPIVAPSVPTTEPTTVPTVPVVPTQPEAPTPTVYELNVAKCNLPENESVKQECNQLASSFKDEPIIVYSLFTLNKKITEIKSSKDESVKVFIYDPFLAEKQRIAQQFITPPIDVSIKLNTQVITCSKELMSFKNFGSFYAENSEIVLAQQWLCLEETKICPDAWVCTQNCANHMIYLNNLCKQYE